MNNEKKEICAECGGACCKSMPGQAAPEDVLSKYETLEAALKSGQWSIDWYGDLDLDPIYYMRPRIVGADIVDPSYGGRCILLTETGCSLSFDERPIACRELEVNQNKKCRVSKSKKQYAELWNDYQTELLELRFDFWDE